MGQYLGRKFIVVSAWSLLQGRKYKIILVTLGKSALVVDESDGLGREQDFVAIAN